MVNVHSSFGKFTAYMENVKFHLPTMNFKLPRVIVVGGKSAGKSSLLEMITKCPMFPRHSSFCTKLPIKLQLKNVPTATEYAATVCFRDQVLHVELTDMLAEVDKIMQQVDGVIDEPIIEEICKVRQGTLSGQIT